MYWLEFVLSRIFYVLYSVKPDPTFGFAHVLYISHVIMSTQEKEGEMSVESYHVEG